MQGVMKLLRQGGGRDTVRAGGRSFRLTLEPIEESAQAGNPSFMDVSAHSMLDSNQPVEQMDPDSLERETSSSESSGSEQGAVEALEEDLLLAGEAGQRRALSGPDMLSLEEASQQSGIPVRTLTQMRVGNRLLALARPGALRGYRFPAFQFQPEVLEVLPSILVAFGPGRAWQAYDFLTRPEPLLGGKVPIELLRRATGRAGEVERVVKAAATLVHGAH